MELSNINQSSPLEKSQNESSYLFSNTTTNKDSTINTSFRPSLNDELSDEMKQDVEYKPSQNIVQEKTQSISNQEEQRLQKLQQKEFLINLQKNTSTSGTSYSRNMDESIVMHAQRKDIDSNKTDEPLSKNIQADDYLEDQLYIDPAAEELFEEFLNPQKKKKDIDPESALKNFENNKKQQNNDNQKKKHSIYEFENDEIINKDLLKISPQNIQVVTGIIQDKNNLKTNQNQKQNVNPALQKALKKDNHKNNINKLRQKFNKK